MGRLAADLLTGPLGRLVGFVLELLAAGASALRDRFSRSGARGRAGA